MVDFVILIALKISKKNQQNKYKKIRQKNEDLELKNMRLSYEKIQFQQSYNKLLQSLHLEKEHQLENERILDKRLEDSIFNINNNNTLLSKTSPFDEVCVLCLANKKVISMRECGHWWTNHCQDCLGIFF